MKNEKKSIID